MKIKVITPRLLLALLTCALMTSCVGKKKFDEMVIQKDQEIADMKTNMEKLEMDMQTKIEDLNTKNSDLTKQKNNITKNLADVKSELTDTKKDLDDVEVRVDQKQKQIDNLRSEINAAFANVDVAVSNSSQRIKNIEGQLYLDLNDDINFRSASARIQKGDMSAVQEIADMLIGNPQLTLFVEGHADNRGIVTGKFEDNWDLSAARGISVVRKLIELGVNPKQLAAAGRAEFLPEMEGDSKEAHEANRRTEFVIVPNVGKLYRIKNSKDENP